MATKQRTLTLTIDEDLVQELLAAGRPGDDFDAVLQRAITTFVRLNKDKDRLVLRRRAACGSLRSAASRDAGIMAGRGALEGRKATVLPREALVHEHPRSRLGDTP